MNDVEWKECTLGDAITFKNGKKRPEMSGEFPVYGGNGILAYISEYNNENCIAIGRVGAYCGSIYYESKKCWVSDNAIVAIPKENNDVRFCYYLLKTLHLNQRCIGTGQPLLTQEILNRIEVSLPPLAEQQRIAGILSSLDDKIELNNAINKNLEEQAQTIFKNWFIDYAPFGGTMPDGWKVGKLSDIGTVVAGGTPSKAKEEYYTNNGIAWITPKDLSLYPNKFTSKGEIDITQEGYDNSSAKLMPKGTVLFSSRAPIGYITIAQNDICTNQGFKSVVPKPNIGSPYIYFYLKTHTEEIENKSSGSTFKEASGSLMNSLDAVIPSDDSLAEFNALCYPIFEQQEMLEKENQQLATLRDNLLSKLMSEQIGV